MIRYVAPLFRAPLALVALTNLLLPVTGAAHDPLISGRTPDPKVAVEKRYPDTSGGFQIWLTNADAGTEALLYTTPRTAWLMYARDMGWLVVNDAEGSGSTRFKLFRRVGEKGSVEYELVEDLTERAWKYFEAETGRDASVLHHDYAMVVAWLDDPDALLIRLSGHGGPTAYRVEDWVCAYRLEERAFTTDLGEVNDGRVVDPKR